MTILPSELRLGDEDSETGQDQAELRKQRRRIQKRKTQRARRHRLVDTRSAGGQDPRPYRVDCWRLDELEQSPGLPAKNATLGTEALDLEPNHPTDAPLDDTHQPLAVPSTTVASRQPSSSSAFTHREPRVMPAEGFPLSVDHLLHIIQFNVLIGLRSNKVVVQRGHHCRDGKTPPPIESGMPDTLMPTALQMDQHHAAWIDMIPFPRVRDNLIRWEGWFNHRDFLKDLVGETGRTAPLSGIDCWKDIPVDTMTLEACRNSDANHERMGLIIWGEAHELSSWELTPGFLAKWMWAVEGCEELLIGLSNRWRLARGDEPMRLITSSPRAILPS